MKELRRNEFIDMLEMAELLYEANDKFIKCDIPTLGKVTYYPKADKLQINQTNKWEVGGFEFVKNILAEKTIQIDQAYIDKVTSISERIKQKSDEELRDEFAGLAMQSIIGGGITISDESLLLEAYHYVAKNAYSVADEMMKQRKVKTE